MSKGNVSVALVGFGYWGPNLARNFNVCSQTTLSSICEFNEKRQKEAARLFPQAKVTSDFNQLLSDKSIDAIAVATPVSTHFELCKQILESGKHVWVEKPMTFSLDQARELERISKEKKLVCMVDHTFLFTGAVKKLKQLISSGELGDLYYYDSVRSNLGLFQHDVNVIYDLAPHEFSILAYLIPEDPISVQAMGSSHAGNDLENLAYIHIEYPGHKIAHFHLSWLAPVKLRRTVIGGNKKMVLYDDIEATEKIKIYDKGIMVHRGEGEESKFKIDYRLGDMIAPKLEQTEALAKAVEHFSEVIKNGSAPITGAELGVKVMRMIEAAQLSIKENGRRVELGSL